MKYFKPFLFTLDGDGNNNNNYDNLYFLMPVGKFVWPGCPLWAAKGSDTKIQLSYYPYSINNMYPYFQFSAWNHKNDSWLTREGKPQVTDERAGCLRLTGREEYGRETCTSNIDDCSLKKSEAGVRAKMTTSWFSDHDTTVPVLPANSPDLSYNYCSSVNRKIRSIWPNNTDKL